MLSLGLAACALSARADNRHLDPTCIAGPEKLTPALPLSRGPMDNYWGHQGYPYVPDRTGQTHFLTRIETEKDGVLSKIIAMPYDGNLFPAAYEERNWNDADSRWDVTVSKNYEWDAEGRMLTNSDQIFVFDSEGRLASCEYVYPDNNMRYSYEYDETGRPTKVSTDLIYPDKVTPYAVEDYVWTEVDGVVTGEVTRRYYNEETRAWHLSSKEVSKTYDTPEGGWTEQTNYVIASDGVTFVIDNIQHQTIRRIIPGMVNGYVASNHEERRFDDKLLVTSDWTANITDLGNHTVRIEATGCEYEYYSDGSLRLERPVKQLTELQAWEYAPGSWGQLTLYSKAYRLDTNSGEMVLSREIKREYDERGQYLRYDDINYYTSYVDRNLTVFNRDESGREYERVEYNGRDGELDPYQRHKMTYVGDSRAFNTFEYAYYDKEAKDWRVPGEVYEYEWETSVEGGKCYIFGASVAGYSPEIAYMPISRKLTKTSDKGIRSVVLERYYFNTSEELGGVESVAVDCPAADAPVTVYSVSGANLGVYGSLEEAPLPEGLYIVRRGGAVGKAFKR